MSPPSWAAASLAALLAALLAGPLASPAVARPVGAVPSSGSPTSFLIVNPAGRGNQGLAEGFLADFGAAVESAWPSDAPWPGFKGRYHVTSADALASIRRERPTVALVSPGFYLEHRKSLDLHVLAVPQRAEGESVVRILAREGGSPARPPRVGGQLAAESDWLRAVVIGEDHAWLTGEPLLVPVARSLEAVRMAEAGELDFIVLHDAEWQVLQRSSKGKDLRVVATSESLPEGPLVSFGTPGAAARAAAKAMIDFTRTEPGRRVLSRMTLRSFVAADDSLFDGVATRLAAWRLATRSAVQSETLR